MFDLAVIVVATVAGAVASVAGFGIGSLLTPLFALQVGTKTAVAAVSLPHFIGSALRCWLFRANINRSVLWRFGIASAAGGLTGALLNEQLSSPTLAVVFGALLVLAGSAELTGFAQRWRFRGGLAWVAGTLSGFFGGLVGNQGGIRSAAMLEFGLTKDQFVATATATAVLVDVVRVPVYLRVEGAAIAAIAPEVALAAAGVVVGTVVGRPLLARIPDQRFRPVVGGVILLLGFAFLLQARI